jgi:hypothetical protein
VRDVGLVSAGRANILGSFYDRDYVLKLTHGPHPAEDILVEQLMEKSVISAQRHTPLTQ